MTLEHILLEESDQFLILTLNRPKALNALNQKVFEELEYVLTNRIPDLCRGIIITGAGDKAFVAGADIKEFLSLDNESAEKLSSNGQRIFQMIEDLPIPAIAAVNGYALGGGCELAMACHMRIVSNTAKFGQPEVNLGIIPGYGGTQRLTRLVGRTKALEWIMTGELIDANKALALGLVNVVVDQEMVLSESIKLLEKISLKAPLAIAAAIRTVNAADNDTSSGYRMEATEFGRLADTKDFKEGSTAFIEKRKAIFKGN